jgi:hypothetical protein
LSDLTAVSALISPKLLLARFDGVVGFSQIIYIFGAVTYFLPTLLFNVLSPSFITMKDFTLYMFSSLEPVFGGSLTKLPRSNHSSNNAVTIKCVSASSSGRKY